MKKILLVLLMIITVVAVKIPAHAADYETVYLDPNGGSCETSILTYSVANYDSVLLGNLPVCIKNGYVFLGWKDADEKTVKQTTLLKDVAKDSSGKKMLKAYYTSEKKIIKFNANGGTCKTASKEVLYNHAIGDLPIPSMEGYIFTGWYTQKKNGEKFTNQTMYLYTYGITLYAQWEKDTSIPDVTKDNKASKLKKGNGKIALSWKPVKGVSGYQIKYSTKKSFKKSYSKTLNIKGKHKKKCTIKNLEKKKKYYIKIRAYKKKGKKFIYSKWSGTISKKAK